MDPNAAPRSDGKPRMTIAQRDALRRKCADYSVPFQEDHYHPTFDLPQGYVAGWVGGFDGQATKPTIYVGVSSEGEISS